ncbi:alkaline shock response membrane anchor protein AmaP [Streptacidiphilus cavernicola]|uniref:Alkaline shock response membrane anchor protein AmaP n=1 Tax=Streptacidiphilus cavernicola TaxID=3342716 RepID=A0ABV6W157_9ACTN
MSRTAVNRTLLALVGLVLLAGGALLLAGGLDLNHRWHLGLPADWTVTDPHHPVLDAADRTRWRGDSWWWPVLFAALGVVAALGLWWLLAQLRRGLTHQVTVPDADTGGTPVRLRGDALAAAVTDGAEQIPGVARARVRLVGRAHRPHARIALLLEPGAAPAPVLRALSEGPLDDARRSSGLTALRADARLRVDPGEVDRVR